MTGAFKMLAVVSSGSLLLLYLGCSLAVLKLRKMDVKPDAHVFVLPGGPLIPVASSLVIVWLLSNMTQAEALGLGGLMVISTVAYFVFHRRT